MTAPTSGAVAKATWRLLPAVLAILLVCLAGIHASEGSWGWAVFSGLAALSTFIQTATDRVVEAIEGRPMAVTVDRIEVSQR